MNWLLTALFYALVIEIALLLPFLTVIRKVVNSSNKAIRIIASKNVSDHWKEKAVAAYAQTTFVNSLKLGFLIFVVLSVAAVYILILDYIAEGFFDFVLGWAAIGFGLLFATFYYYIRKSISSGRL